MVEHGATPTVSADQAREMGFKVIIFPFAALAPAYAAVKGGMETLKRDGRMGSQECLTPQMLFRVCGLDGSVKVDVEAGWGWEF